MNCIGLVHNYVQVNLCGGSDNHLGSLTMGKLYNEETFIT
jgi:hypothetical protein